MARIPSAGAEATSARPAESPLPEEELSSLLRLLRWSRGFVLAFVRSNVPIESRRLVDELSKRLAADGPCVRDLSLVEPTSNLLSEIHRLAPPVIEGEAVVVVGFEHSMPSHISHPPALDRLNRSREQFRELPCPVVLILPDYALNQLAREAPDFWAWRSGIFTTHPAAGRPPIEPRELYSGQLDLWNLPLERKKDHLEVLRELLADLERSETGNEAKKSELCLRISILHHGLGQLDDALLYARKALEHAGEESRRRALALRQVADIYQDRGDLEEALRIYQEELLPVFVSSGDSRDRAITLGKISEIFQTRGQLDEALRILQEEVVPILERVGDAHSRTVALTRIAGIHQIDGNIDKALQVFQEKILPASQELANARSHAVTMGRMADLYQIQGRLEEALRIRQEDELPVFQRLGDRLEEARVLWRIAQIELQRQETRSATQHMTEAYTIFFQMGATAGMAIVGLDLARILLGGGQIEEAHVLLQRSRDGFAKLGRRAELEETEALLDATAARPEIDDV